ncbi:hypothetical protein J4448_02270 [Candidatus Woesearchaeota archaeon]|nr:hypothetical protein [Candidatus Woesearchaeota archaeon]
MVPAVYDKINGKPQSLTVIYNGRHQQFKGEEFNVTIFGGLELTAILLAPKPNSKLNGSVPDEIRPEIEAELRILGYTKKPIYPSLQD